MSRSAPLALNAGRSLGLKHAGPRTRTADRNIGGPRYPLAVEYAGFS